MTDINLTKRTMPWRVLIADDSEGDTGGLEELLSEHEEIEIVGSARKTIEALVLVEKLQPDVILLDLEMPGNGLAYILTLIKAQPKRPKIVVLIPYASSVLRERGLDAGADYVFARTGDSERLISALGRLINGHQFRSIQ